VKSGVPGYETALVRTVLRGVEGRARRRMTEAVGGYRGSGGEPRQKEVEEGGLGGWLVMHCANSPRRGHVTRTPGLSLIAPRRNVGHTVLTKHCTLHLTSFRRTSPKPNRDRESRWTEDVSLLALYGTSSRRSIISRFVAYQVSFSPS